LALYSLVVFSGAIRPVVVTAVARGPTSLPKTTVVDE
jgi:hypothetical protein